MYMNISFIRESQSLKCMHIEYLIKIPQKLMAHNHHKYTPQPPTTHSRFAHKISISISITICSAYISAMHSLASTKYSLFPIHKYVIQQCDWSPDSASSSYSRHSTQSLGPQIRNIFRTIHFVCIFTFIGRVSAIARASLYVS